VDPPWPPASNVGEAYGYVVGVDEVVTFPVATGAVPFPPAAVVPAAGACVIVIGKGTDVVTGMRPKTQ
jgi:hypothetical protein